MQNKVEMINLNKIHFSNDRLRTAYDGIDGLKKDILEARGLIHSLCVHPIQEGLFMLVAGGRRHIALSELFAKGELKGIYPEGKVPCTLVDKDISGEAIVALELMENLSRQDMTPYDIAKGRLRIHDVMVSRHDGKDWSIRDTANTMNIAHTTLYDDQKLVSAADIDISIKEAKTRMEMQNKTKKLQKAVSASIAQVKVEMAEESGKLNPKIKRLIDSFQVGDSLESILKYPDECCDLVELDTPYGIDLNKEKAAQADSKSTYFEWSAAEYCKHIPFLLNEAYRILKPDGWIIFWFAPDPWWEFVHECFSKTDFKGRMQPAIWLKGCGQTKSPDYNMASSFEYYLYFRKGNAKLNTPGQSNFHAVKPIASSNKVHLTEKPIDLYEAMLPIFIPSGSSCMTTNSAPSSEKIIGATL